MFDEERLIKSKLITTNKLITNKMTTNSLMANNLITNKMAKNKMTTNKPFYISPQIRPLSLATSALCSGSDYVGDDAWTKKKDWEEDEENAATDEAPAAFWLN